jgi:hypothetical protein
MPMHDWTRVEAGIYHAFHGPWLQAVARVLNNGLLPDDYYALPEQVTAGVEPDVVTPHIPTASKPTGADRVTELDSNPPAVRLLERGRRATRRRTLRRLAVRHVSTHRVVAVVELVSPGNKSSRRDFTAFVRKAVALVDAGIHVLVVDPFPPTDRDPNGIHDAIWNRVARRADRGRFARPAGEPLTCVSYAAGAELVAAVQSFAVGRDVPTMPLFLTAERFVSVPLESAYQGGLAGRAAGVAGGAGSHPADVMITHFLTD